MRRRERAGAGTLGHYRCGRGFTRAPVDHHRVRVLGAHICETPGHRDRTVFVDHGRIHTQTRHHRIHIVHRDIHAGTGRAAVVIGHRGADRVGVGRVACRVVVQVLVRGREGAAAGTLRHRGCRGCFPCAPVDHHGVRVLGAHIREAAGHGDRTVFIDHR